jgi:hypothetical protein
MKVDPTTSDIKMAELVASLLARCCSRSIKVQPSITQWRDDRSVGGVAETEAMDGDNGARREVVRRPWWRRGARAGASTEATRAFLASTDDLGPPHRSRCAACEVDGSARPCSGVSLHVPCFSNRDLLTKHKKNTGSFREEEEWEWRMYK